MAKRIAATGIYTYMTFTAWLHQRLKLLPDADKLPELIRQAGKNGIPEGQLRRQVDLPMRIVDDLLAALVGAGQAAVVMRAGRRWYFAR